MLPHIRQNLFCDPGQPKNIDLKSIEHAKLYRDIKVYQDKAAESRLNVERGYAEKKGLSMPDNVNGFPRDIKRLVGAFEYTLPDRAK